MSIKRLAAKLERLQREIREYAATVAISKENKKPIAKPCQRTANKNKPNYNLIIIRTLNAPKDLM